MISENDFLLTYFIIGLGDVWMIIGMTTSSNGNSFRALCEEIHRSPVDSPRKDQWALMFSLICAWTNDWAHNQDTGDVIWDVMTLIVTLL